MRVRLTVWMVLATGCVLASVGVADDSDTSSAERGAKLLRTRSYLPADFDQEVFDSLWKVWPEPLRSQAEQATPAERRRMAFSRYGLIESAESGANAVDPGLGYVSRGGSGWAMTCLACHGGKVAGQVVPGLPNSHYALETLTEEVRLTKLALKKPLTHMDLAQLSMPLGGTVGTTNSVMFGVALGALRDADMNVDKKRPAPKLMHHDMDPPPFWNVRRKSRIYCDGFAPKNHRVIMQFMMLPSNGKTTMQGWENDYRDILAWIESTQPPKYPFDVDQALAARGEKVFEANCARCHGTYGPDGEYPETTVAIEEIGTDPVRLRSLSRAHREWMKNSWLTHYGQDDVVLEPKGYVAPPLDGIWATGPYFHNGSAPTLWHVLHPDQRPTVWTRRSEDGYDREKLGLVIDSMKELPEDVAASADRRRYFDTRVPGKSADGHLFPNRLTEGEKRAVLEYLKTL